MFEKTPATGVGKWMIKDANQKRTLRKLSMTFLGQVI